MTNKHSSLFHSRMSSFLFNLQHTSTITSFVHSVSLNFLKYAYLFEQIKPQFYNNHSDQEAECYQWLRGPPNIPHIQQLS